MSTSFMNGPKSCKLKSMFTMKFKEPKCKLILGRFKNKSWKVPFFVFKVLLFWILDVENYASKECPKKVLILSCLKIILELISQTVWHYFIQRVVPAG